MPLVPGRTAALLASLLLAPAARPSDLAPVQPTLRIEPARVEIGLLHRGATVRVEGVAPAGVRLALVCLGKSGRVELKQKGKVANVLWVNVGSIAFDRVPSLLLVSSEPAEDRAAAVVVPADLRLPAELDEVETRVLPAQADERTRRLFRDLARLKVQERLWSFGRLSRDGADGLPTTRVSTEFSLPASAPPGEYEVQLVGYRDGRGEVLASRKLVAERVGLVELVSGMAERHGFLYGVLSVLVAIAAGFFSGFLFSGAKKVH